MTLFDITSDASDYRTHRPAPAFGVPDPYDSLAGPRSSHITVGTLLHIAEQAGANFDQWKRQVLRPPPIPPAQRKPLQGGDYSRDEALELLNSHYLIGKTDQYVAVFRIEHGGSLVFTPADQFKLDVANIFVKSSKNPAKQSCASQDKTAEASKSEGAKRIPVEKFWKEHPQRHQRRIVFKPGGTTEPDEFNLWQGFGVTPRRGWQKQRRLMRHIWQIICQRDRAKFRYLIRWLAWAVQHPDEHSETVIVLISRREGTGKSTLGLVMLKIFGPHGALIDDKERLLNRFNDWLEKVSFVVAEEILWAGDHRTADKLKSMITGATLQLERKNGGIWQSPNHLHAMMNTNHDHAVPAGVGNRRYVVYDVSDEYACDKTWFDPLYRDLDNGVSEFLYFLQNLNLGDWHPRQILKTAEATEQQRMSADSVAQWSQACISADAIIGAGKGAYGSDRTHDLGMWVSTEALREAYAGYCKQQGLRAANEVVFGQACAKMFGERKRSKTQQSGNNQRPWGYEVPQGEQWQEKVDARLGIKS
jgi:hypothetical protein